MNPAIVRKTFRDALPLLVILTTAAILIEFLFVVFFREFSQDLPEILLNFKFVRGIVRALAGADLLGEINPTTLASIGLAHSLLHALCWTLLLTICTRVTVGEIDRGTAALLLTLPVSRAAVYVSTSLVWLTCAAIISGASLCGIWLGDLLLTLPERIDLHRLALVVVNLFFLNAAIGSVAALVSSLLSRRGAAVGIVLGLLLASFLLGFLAQAWTVAERISFLGLLYYYQPLPIVRNGAIPPAALITLAAIAAVAWSLGLWQFRRRDIPAV